MSDEQLITYEDIWQFVQYGTKEGFSQDITSFFMNKQIELDFLLEMINTLLAQIQSSLLSHGVSKTVYQSYTNAQSADFYTILDNQTNEIYVQLTRVYYLIRTFFTGESIKFLETIEGEERVIEQDDWLGLLSGSVIAKNWKTGKIYGHKYQGIFLDEDLLMNLGTSIEESQDFSQVSRVSKPVIDKLLEAGNFDYQNSIFEGDVVPGTTDHKLYRKIGIDDWVYAYYSGKAKNLLYNKEISYNLGILKEQAWTKLEQQLSITDQLKYISLLNDSNHPLQYILGLQKVQQKQNKNNIAATVEGDFRTSTGQWIQSKRHNSQVMKTMQIHNAILNIRTQLLQLKNTLSNNTTALDNIADQFYTQFSSAQQIIDEKVKNKIRSQIGILAGQSII